MGGSARTGDRPYRGRMIPRPPEPDRRRARMFTGIVEDLGEVEAVEHSGDFARIYVRTARASEDARHGDSIAVNGVCLTVTALIAGDPGDTSPPAKGSPPGGFVAEVMG